METAVLILFIFMLFLVLLYSFSQLNLLLNFLGQRDFLDKSPQLDFSRSGEIPFVTVQLPIYNEQNVIERLLKNIGELEYPKDKLEIQVLDDSTDGSCGLTSRLVENLRTSGLDIQHLRRSSRQGFKAGALREGLKVATGEYIAVFDSDFLPQKDWLLQTIPYFKDVNIGVVQTRWGHLNRNYSTLTKIQAFALDFHFILEQTGRNAGDHFINFNGTAGVWRKQCILDSGNWEGDTLTEDLDLSYRAQLKNWKFKYLEKVETPAELPITIQAARSQQFRWNKGAAENFQKSFRKILISKHLPWQTKIHCFFHLLNSSLFLLVLGVALLSVPVLVLTSDPQFSFYLGIMSIFSVSTIILFVCYWTSFARINGTSFKNFLEYVGMFFTFFSIAMGFSVHNSRAVLEGHFGKKSEFVRTPKFNISGRPGIGPKKMRTPVKFSLQLLLEISLMLYFGSAILYAIEMKNFSMILFHLMLFSGFGFVVFNTLRPFKVYSRSYV